MDRRDFLKAASTTALASAAGSTALIAQPVGAPASLLGARRFVLALPQSIDTLEVRTLAARLQRQLSSALTNTEVVIETTVSGGIEAVSQGFADFYIGIDSQHAAAHPALPLFAGMPLGHDCAPETHCAWLRGPGQTLWAAALAATDIVAIPFGHTGTSPGLYTDTAFVTGADLRGVRVAARGLAAEALGLLGAKVSMHDSDSACGQDAGAVAARGLTATEPLLTPFDAKAQWAYQPGVTPGGLVVSLGMRASLWERIATSDRLIITGLASETLAVSLDLAAHRDETLQHVAQVRRWPTNTAMPDLFTRDVKAAADAVLHDLAAREPLARLALESHRQFAARVA
jgi:TRAP-type mannitol/chloroaromatic compound transport system substrate-binding protein